MKNSIFKTLFLCFLATAGLLACSCNGNNSNSKDADGGVACAITIGVSSDGSLSCSNTLTVAHQQEIAMAVKNNHGLACKEIGDSIRISGLVMEWVPNGDGGWDRTVARCTAQYMAEPAKSLDLLEDHANSIQSILTQSAYCPLGASCQDPCGCDEICCIGNEDCCHDRGEPCSARITTGGVIIAVVSSVPAQ